MGTKFQSFLTQSSANFATWKTWASQIGVGLTSAGWVFDTDAGTVNWSNVTKIGSGIRSASRRYQGTFSGSTPYVGVTSDNGTNDFVIDGSESNNAYLCVANTQLTTLTSVLNASGGNTTYNATGGGLSPFGLAGTQVTISGFTNGANNGTFTVVSSTSTTLVVANAGGVAETHAGTVISITAPSANINNGTTGFWAALVYEVFKTNDSTGFPLYLMLTYFAGSGTPGPGINFELGTSHPTTGTGAGTQGAVVPSLWNRNVSTAPPQNILTLNSNNGGTATVSECDFHASGDGDYAFSLWNNPLGSHGTFFSLNRARDNAGNPLGTYVTILHSFQSTATGTQWEVIYNNNVIFPPTIGSSFTNQWPTIAAVAAVGNAPIFNDLTPIFPVFPIVGYVANPCLEVVVAPTGVFVAGALGNVVLYGASHTYKFVNFGRTMDGTSGLAIGMRWE